MALAFPSLPGIRPIRGLGDGVPQRDQGRVSKNLPLQSSSATRISMFGLWRPAPVCTKRTVLVSFAWSTVVETALRGEETSSCVTVPPRRKYCVRVMRFMITLGPHGMSMPRQVPGWPRKCSPKTRINYEGVQSALTQLVQKPQSSDS